MWTILLFFVLTSFIASIDSQKQNRLVLLAFSMMTGNEPANGSMCRAAMEVVVNASNNHKEILRDYFIEIDHQDEMMGAASPRHVINFGRRFEVQKTLSKRTEYQAPIALGNAITTGCASTGRFLHHVGMVSIATGCLSPLMTNIRQDLPNVYRSRAPGELTIFTRIQFIKNIGQWKEIAIITHAANSMDYYIAKQMFKEALASDIHVIWFDAVYDFTDAVMESLKKSDARIITVETNQGIYFTRFLCQSYKNGITGSRYVIIAANNAYSDPSKFPYNIPNNPGCTREMVIEQIKYVFWTGSPSTRIENTGLEEQRLPLGYTGKEFGERFDALTKGKRDPDYSSMQGCHDVMTHALLALDTADRKLKKQNLSLLSFSDYPKIVMLAVNESVAEMSFPTIRVPFSKYSQRLERDFEPQTVGYWFANEYTYRNLFVMKANETLEAIYDYESYKITMLRQPLWMTENGLPPRDKWLLKYSIKGIPEAVLAIVVSCSIALGIAQIGATLYILYHRKRPQIFRSLAFSKAIFALGCLALNASASMFSLDVTKTSICIIRFSLGAVGMALICGYLLCKMTFYIRQVNNLVLSNTQGSAMQICEISGNQRINFRNFWENTAYNIHSNKLLDGIVIAASSGYAVLTAVGIAIWQVVTPYYHAIDRSPPVYYNELDTYIITETYNCDIKDPYSWMGIQAVHFFTLVVDCFLAFRLRSSVAANKAPEFSVMKAAVANTTILYCGATLVFLILDDKLTRQIVVAFACLIISASTSAIVLLTTIKSSLDYPSLPILRQIGTAENLQNPH